MRRVIGCVVAAGLLAACAPKTGVHLTIRNYANDVTYGDQSSPSIPKPAPAAELMPTFPAFIQPPLAPPSLVVPSTPPTTFPLPAPPPKLDLCPKASPFAFPSLNAGPHVLAAPKQGIYLYRQTGSYTIDGKSGAPQAQAVRSVQNIATQSNGTITFDVADVEGQSATLTSYEIMQSTGNSTTDGIFITQVVTKAADGTISQFAPQPAIRIMPLPAQNSQQSFQSAGVDAIHGLTEEISGTIVSRQRVDACGTVLDSWEVHVTGRLLSSSEDLALDATYDIGTQFGGLSLEDKLTLSGTDAGGSVQRTTTAIIDNVPPQAGAAG